MTTLTLPAPAPTEQDGPRPLRWTREEYYQLAQEGHFDGKRVMLIEGEIIVMSPQNEPHSRGITLTGWAVEAAFGDGFYARVQMPLDLRQASDPEPDIAVVTGSPRTNVVRPTTALLVVEVADSSLTFDTGAKASLYAAGGIADYWVVDLVHDRLTVFRNPRPDAAAAHGHSYSTVSHHGPADTIAPLAAPTSPVRVADLLP